MIVQGDPAFNEGPADIRTALAISTAIESVDGGQRCGDIAYVLPLLSGRTAFVVIDVAGHGRARAPLSSALAGAVTASLERDGSPAMALGCANRLLLASADASPYAVGFVALVHPVLRTVIYASAGHDVAFALGADGRIRHLAQTGAMLGIPLADHACDALFLLAADETLVIATDGISDSRPAVSQHFFGAGGTARAVTQSLRVGDDPARAVLAAALVHEGGHQTDDVAVVVARFGPLRTRRRTHHRVASLRFESGALKIQRGAIHGQSSRGSIAPQCGRAPSSGGGFSRTSR